MYSTFYNFLDKKRSHFAYSNLKIETLEQGVKYVQS